MKKTKTVLSDNLIKCAKKLIIAKRQKGSTFTDVNLLQLSIEFVNSCHYLTLFGWDDIMVGSFNGVDYQCEEVRILLKEFKSEFKRQNIII